MRNNSTSEVVLILDAIVLSDSYCSNRLHIRQNIRVLTMELLSVPKYVIRLSGLMPWKCIPL